ncbi:MAG: anhydro-N-acetylmuramic acid kinase [Bacteroidales bacterium]
MNTFKVIGLMSGTSLDGVDLACCEFNKLQNRWDYKIVNAATVPYPAEMMDRLLQAPQNSAYELALLNKDYGHYLGTLVKEFAAKTRFNPDLVASHGHTLFHQPWHRLTYQLGDGAALSAVSGFPVVCDFRTSDVALGGQGAPLVPVGDKLLFGNFSSCLNLGGFSNISYDVKGSRIAHDISPCNMALNRLAMKAGHQYDKNGELSRQGEIIPVLFDQLNDLDFYFLPAPKSLGREWFEEKFIPLIDREDYKLTDLLRTLTEHIAFQTARSIEHLSSGTLLITGGGAHNTYLVERIKNRVLLEITVPGKNLIDFKEALVFAFLGLLRSQGEINVLASVTGASADHTAGALYL